MEALRILVSSRGTGTIIRIEVFLQQRNRRIKHIYIYIYIYIYISADLFQSESVLDHIFIKRYLSILQTPFSLKHGPVSGAYHSRAGRGGPTIASIRTSSEEVHGVSEMIAQKFPCRRQPSRDCEDCDRSASRCTHLSYPHIHARGSFSKTIQLPTFRAKWSTS